jgi:hypothetical protein
MVGETTVHGWHPPDAPFRFVYKNNGQGRVRSTAHRIVFRSPFVSPTPWENAHTWLTNVGGPLLDAMGTSTNLWGSWGSPEHAFHPVYRYANGFGYDWSEPGSSHPSGGQFCLADGSVRFVPYTVSTGVGTTQCGTGAPICYGDVIGRYGNMWAAMHTINGDTAHPPNEQTPVVWP